MIDITVAYATLSDQVEIPLQVEANCLVELAIKRSGLLSRFPDIVLAESQVGIYGTPATLDASLDDGDRIEIYRPLKIDPKSVRRLRAKVRGVDPYPSVTNL